MGTNTLLVPNLKVYWGDQSPPVPTVVAPMCIAYMAFQYHVGPSHLREAIPWSGSLGWFALALSDF